MKNERNNLKAGVFILASVALIVTVILSIKGIGRIFAPQQERLASFKLADDLGGLQVGDEVRLGGFKVGVVKDIEVREDSGERAAATTAPAGDESRLLVRFTLPSRYALKEDAVIGIQTTVTGTACLNISSLGSGVPAKPEFVLVGKPSSLNAVLTALGDVSGEIKPAVADARATIGDVRVKVVPKLSDTLVEFKGAGANLKDMLGDTKGDFRDTIANLKDVTGTVKTKLPDTMDSAKRFIDRLDKTVEDAQGTLEDVKVAIHNFVDVSKRAKEIVGGNKGKLDSMIASLKTTGDNLKAASSEIRHSPWRLLYKPGKGEVANLNLYDSARQFADGATSLNEAALALRDALATEDANPEHVKELLLKLDTSFANFRAVEDKLWTTVKE